MLEDIFYGIKCRRHQSVKKYFHEISMERSGKIIIIDIDIDKVTDVHK